MAKMPPEMAADDQAEPAEPMGMAPEESAAEKPTMLCTVLLNKDGSFQLVTGDENEAIHEEGGEPVEQEGESYDEPGPLLKAILDLVENAQTAGEGSADENFKAGFEGGAAASPTKIKQTPAERY